MNNIRKNTLSHWLLPFFLGIVIFNVLRAVTDLTRDHYFWPGSIHQHLVSQGLTILVCYFMDYAFRKRLKRVEQKLTISNPAVKEYLRIVVSLLIWINTIMFIGEQAGFLYIGNGFVDYILANLVFIPISLLYYAMLRNDVVSKNLIEQVYNLEKMKNTHLDTELKYLKSQYHPHFLFNALNTIYFQTKEEEAKQSIELLSGLLRYQLYNVNKIVALKDEITFIQSYIRFQKQRVSRRLNLTEEYDSQLAEQKIHPLLFQPLLENAFKYLGGEYWIKLSFKLDGDVLSFTIENAVSDVNQNKEGHKGIGIENLRRRLDILYPSCHELKLIKGDYSFLAELRIHITDN